MNRSTFSKALQQPVSKASSANTSAGLRNLHQLIQLRWIAVVGQLLTIQATHYSLGLPLPLQAMLSIVAGMVVFNIASLLRWRTRRGVHDHLARINTSIDNVRDTISTAIQVNLSMVAIEESEDNKKLAAWAGIFAVATAFAGIWGMNFRAMPELDWEYGYPVALSVITLTSVLLYRRFKRAGWL